MRRLICLTGYGSLCVTWRKKPSPSMARAKRGFGVLLYGLLGSVSTCSGAGAQTTPPLPQGTAGQVSPYGVTPLPQQPPPTGMQAPLPTAVQRMPPPGSPAAKSPTLAQLAAKLAAQPLTLDTAVTVALSTNRQLALSTSALYRAQGFTAEVRSGLYPTLGVSAGPVYLASVLDPGAQVAATVPFDISGAIRAAASQAQFQEVATRLDINRTRNQIVSDVKAAFYNVLRAEALVGVASENLQNSLDRLSDANVRYQARTVAYFDVLRAQTDVADGQRQVIQARNGVSLAVGSLNNTIGIDVLTPLRVSDRNAVEEPPDVPSPSATPLTPEGNVPASGTGQGMPKAAPAPEAFQGKTTQLIAPRPDEIINQALTLGTEFQPLLKEALVTRPEVLESDAQIAAAQKGILYARRSLLPSLGLTAGYYYVRSSTGTQINEPEASLAITLPLYDAGLARARVQEARADVATAVTNRRQTIDTVTLDVQQSYLNLIQARDQVAVANQALGQARAAFQLARVRYNAGVASRAGLSPLLEVSDAQAALTLAEQNQVNALYDYDGARAQLDRAIGRFAYVPHGPGYDHVPPPKVVGTPQK